MPRSWQYPRLRRILVPTIMWLVLAGAVGIAALVSRQRTQSQHIDLSNRITIDAITIQLPNKWAIIPDGDNLGAIIRESGDSDQQRALMIRLYPVPPNLTSAEFLTRSGLFREPAPSPTDDETQEDLPPLSQEPQPIEIAGSPGILRKALRSYPPTPADPEETQREELIAAAVLPNHQAIVLRLYCPPDTDEENTTLLHRLTAAISLTK
jgi:hypothetical protein